MIRKNEIGTNVEESHEKGVGGERTREEDGKGTLITSISWRK